MITDSETETTMPDQSEVQAAEALRQSLLERIAGGKAQTITLAVNDAPVQVELPRSAFRALMDALAEIAKGNGVAVAPVKRELTTGEAAELIDISRQRLIKLLEDGEIPFHQVGRRRRVRLEDALAWKRKFLAERKIILRELAAQAQELEMGYE